MSKKRVLILCTGNSCRSQMAEALINHYLGDTWEAFSAGTAPTGYVHPMARRVLDALGIDLRFLQSKNVTEFKGQTFDVVITVCDDAAENCPVWLGAGNVVHIGFPDPAKFQGTDEQVINEFRRVRDSIRHKIFAFLKQVEKSAAQISDRQAS